MFQEPAESLLDRRAGEIAGRVAGAILALGHRFARQGATQHFADIGLSAPFEAVSAK